jgi:hypothetical protein
MLRQSHWLALALFVLLAVVHTWPLASDPAHLSRNDNADAVLNEWTIAWVAHQTPRDPLHLFDANIFYPDRNVLAYSEHMFVQSMMGAPLLWSGTSPVLTYNLLLLSGLALTGWSMAFVVARWTGDWMAGVFAGVIVAFNAHTLTRLPHLQAMHVEFLPLALLSLDRLLDKPRISAAVALALWFTLQGLSSYYLLVFTTVALFAGVAVRPGEWCQRGAEQTIALLALSAAIAGVLTLPFLLPYWRLGTVRPLEEVMSYAATWRNYLSTPAHVHYQAWSTRWFGGSAALFPGVSGLALTGVACASGVAFSDRRARMALAFGVLGAAFSFGPTLPGYAFLYRWILPFQGIRNVARFGYLSIVACAILAGFGIAFIRRRWHAAPWLSAFTAAVLLAANVDAFVAPVGFVRAEPVPALYSRLGRQPNAVVAEFPFYPPDRTFFNSPYMLAAARHWHPVLNGYSGLVPDSYVEHYRSLRGFPDEAAIAALRSVGVTDVVVHEREMRARNGNDAANAVGLSRELQLVERDGSISWYRLAAR